MHRPIALRVLYRAMREWHKDRANQMGAALAYYTLFSIAPLLLIATTIASYFFGEEAARKQVSKHLIELVGKESSGAIESVVEHIAKPRHKGWASGIGVGALMFGALGVFLHLRRGFCTIWKLDPPRGNTFLGLLLNYLLAIIMVLCVGLLLLLSLAANTTLVVLLRLLKENFPGQEVPWQAVEFASSIFFLTLLFGSVFRVMSGRRIPYRYVWFGSIVSALLFTVGKTLLGFYLVYTSTASAYGAAGSLVAFLIWVYYSAQIMFFGAELIQAWRTRREWLQADPTSAGKVATP